MHLTATPAPTSAPPGSPPGQPTTSRFAALWPIVDESRSYDELVLEGRAALTGMLTDRDYLRLGTVRWEVRDDVRLPDWPAGSLVLSAVCEVVSARGVTAWAMLTADDRAELLTAEGARVAAAAAAELADIESEREYAAAEARRARWRTQSQNRRNVLREVS